VLGTGAIEGVVGGQKDDVIKGNALANEINGGAGEDTVSGGAGVDKFYFGIGGNTGFDTVLDFAVGQDKIVLNKGFLGLTTAVGGALGTNFAIVTADASVGSSAAAIVYSTASHKLFYNANGTADGVGLGGFGGEMAYFANNANITATDFTVVA
jgi:Ca2+-binding RTX toxin-like protein